jgi:hypothetical protein
MSIQNLSNLEGKNNFATKIWTWEEIFHFIKDQDNPGQETLTMTINLKFQFYSQQRRRRFTASPRLSFTVGGLLFLAACFVFQRFKAQA